MLSRDPRGRRSYLEGARLGIPVGLAAKTAAPARLPLEALQQRHRRGGPQRPRAAARDPRRGRPAARRRRDRGREAQRRRLPDRYLGAAADDPRRRPAGTRGTSGRRLRAAARAGLPRLRAGGAARRVEAPAQLPPPPPPPDPRTRPASAASDSPSGRASSGSSSSSGSSTKRRSPSPGAESAAPARRPRARRAGARRGRAGAGRAGARRSRGPAPPRGPCRGRAARAAERRRDLGDRIEEVGLRALVVAVGRRSRTGRRRDEPRSRAAARPASAATR